MANEHENDASPNLVITVDGSSGSASVGNVWDWCMHEELNEAQYIVADESWENVLAKPDKAGCYRLPGVYTKGIYDRDPARLVWGSKQVFGDDVGCTVLFSVWNSIKNGYNEKERTYFSIDRCVVVLDLHDELDCVPDGYEWVNVRYHTIHHSEEDAQKAIAMELQYRRDGVYPPYRPEWSHRGWFSKTSEWFVEQLESRGMKLKWAVENVAMSPYCTVLRAETDEGEFHLKASSSYCNEAAISALLSSVDPTHVCVPFATDVEKSLMINRDYGEIIGYCMVGLNDCRNLFQSYAKLQMASAAVVKELENAGLPVLSLEWAESQLDVLCEDQEVRRVDGTEEFKLFVEHKEDLRVLLKKLMKLSKKMPMTVVHEEFGFGNVCRSKEKEGEFCFFDWECGYISHPLFGAQFSRDDVLELYMEEWSSVASLETLKEMRQLCEKLRGYISLLITLHGCRSLDENSKWESRRLLPSGLKYAFYEPKDHPNNI